MTVCATSMFFWIYGEGDIGRAFVTASDRMLTDLGLGIEYEGSRQKMAFYGPSRMVLVAGDLAFNSLVLQGLSEVEANDPSPTTTQLAIRLGDVVGRLNSDRASRKFLTPIGLSPAIIAEKEGGLAAFGLPDALTEKIALQMQGEIADSSFIVAGCDGRNAYLFHIDGQGIISSHSDIGFLSIGMGGIHSSAYFMQLPYQHNIGYHRAVADTFFAKKRAEICPGVGSLTDMHLITADGITPISPEAINILEKSYRLYMKSLDRQIGRLTNLLSEQANRAVEHLTPVPADDRPAGRASGSGWA